MIFLWLFLPFVLIINIVLPVKFSNLFLLVMSLIFYAWGEQEYIWVLLVSLIVNYSGARMMEHMRHGRGGRNNSALLLVLILAVNFCFLGYFKYFDFFADLINKAAARQVVEPAGLLLPIGISFYTFQMVSYTVDVYRGDVRAEKSLLRLGLYLSFFPKMIQGPITRYKGVEACIESRRVTPEGFAYGARRFIYGLGKKLILANQFGSVVDKVLSNPVEQISGGLGWYIGILYTLQIYFDFSGYSDMAVGIGKMLGFDLPENFDYPYLSRNVGEFWRRWHISLSSWFRDYLYIPLGGSRKGRRRTCVNLLIVFLCTGFWHGAGLSFVAWGVYYGILQIVERVFLKKRLEMLPAAVSYTYMFFVTVAGWTMFRADSLTRGLILLKQMFLLRSGVYDISMYMTHKTIAYMVVGFVLCGPVQALMPGIRRHMKNGADIYWGESLGLVILFAYCIVIAVGSTYNPFIYFRF